MEGLDIMNERGHWEGSRGNIYVFGTEAHKFETLPRYDERDERAKRAQEIAKKAPKKKARIDVFSVLLVMISFVSVMVIGIIYLNLNFQSTYLSKSVVHLQSEVVEMQKNNAALVEELEDSINLKEIYKKATKKLGMKPMKGSQIRTYQRKHSSEIRQYGTIPGN